MMQGKADCQRREHNWSHTNGGAAGNHGGTWPALLVVLSFMPLILFGQGPEQMKSAAAFEGFYAKFRAAVNQRDRQSLADLMSAKFEWGLDGYVSRDQALRNIDRIVGWQNFWASAQKAVAMKARRCKPPDCEGRAGFHAWAKSPFPLEMMFERDADGKWRWTAFLGE